MLPNSSQRIHSTNNLGQLITELKQHQDIDVALLLKKHNAKKTDPAFAIPEDRGLDIISQDERFFLYPSSKEDKESFKLLKQHNIPVCPVVDFNGNEQFSVASLHFDTVSLAKILYREQAFTCGTYLGACEIMVQLGKYIKSIRNRAHVVPLNITMDAFIMQPSQKELINMAPPLILAAPPSLIEIREKLKKSLMTIDPYNAHERHVQIFINNYL